MKYKTWEAYGNQFTYRVNLLDDVLDLTRFKNRSFTDFKEVLKMPREREAKKLAKDVFTFFLKRVARREWNVRKVPGNWYRTNRIW